MRTWNFRVNVQVTTVPKRVEFFCCIYCTYYWKIPRKDSESAPSLKSSKALFCLLVILYVTEFRPSVTPDRSRPTALRPPRSNGNPDATTVVDKLLMMDMKMPETCWAAFKRQVIKLRDWWIWFVDVFEYIWTSTKCVPFHRALLISALCTVLLPPGGYPIAIKYIISYLRRTCQECEHS
jgi:hypothetical protein